MEPLLNRGSNADKLLTPVEAATAIAHKAIALFIAQYACIVAYVVAAFALANAIGFVAEAAHIAALHAILFIFVALLSGSLRYLQTGELNKGGAISALAASDLFPLTPLLSEAPIIVVTLANALLLPVLGLEAWLRQEIGPNFSVLLMVQILAVAEAVAVSAAGGMLICECTRRKTVPLQEPTSLTLKVSTGILPYIRTTVIPASDALALTEAMFQTATASGTLHLLECYLYVKMPAMDRTIVLYSCIQVMPCGVAPGR